MLLRGNSATHNITHHRIYCFLDDVIIFAVVNSDGVNCHFDEEFRKIYNIQALQHANII